MEKIQIKIQNIGGGKIIRGTILVNHNPAPIHMREFKDLKIAVASTGYVGLSIATLLA